jgi:hypothetical protein
MKAEETPNAQLSTFNYLRGLPREATPFTWTGQRLGLNRQQTKQ